MQDFFIDSMPPLLSAATEQPSFSRARCADQHALAENPAALASELERIEVALRTLRMPERPPGAHSSSTSIGDWSSYPFPVSDETLDDEGNFDRTFRYPQIEEIFAIALCCLAGLIMVAALMIVWLA